MKRPIHHLVLIMSLLICQEGKACFCIPENIETADYSSHEELFLGKVLNIERIEVVERYEDKEYELVGTITTFEALKKWKGNHEKIIKVYQQQNSCGIDFTVTNSRWIISTYRKSFITDAFREKYPGRYMQTDNCNLYIEELANYEEFEKSIKNLDGKFPSEIKLKGSLNYRMWGLVIVLVFGAGLIFKRKEWGAR